MTDIVERLRGGKFSGHDAALDLMDDAADEIERLRKELYEARLRLGLYEARTALEGK